VKRAKLIDRVRLLAEKRGALMMAAKANSGDNEFDRRRAEARIEEAAIEYAVVAIRYLGGER
jgi:hypothetical protein